MRTASGDFSSPHHLRRESAEDGSGEKPEKCLAIGMFIQHFPPRLGGAECQAKILASELAKCGHRVELMTTRHLPELPAKTSRGLLTIRRLPTLAPRWLKLPVNLVTGFLAGLVLARKVDLIHAHCLSPFVLGGLLAARIYGTPTLLKVCTVGKKGDIAKIRDFAFGRLLWPLYRRADMFVAQSEASGSEIVEHGIARSRVVTTHNILEDHGAPVTRVEKDHIRHQLGLADKLTVLYVGRLHPDKGLGQLMKIWPEMAQTYNAQLLLVGEGPQRAEIELWRVKSQLEDSVILTGYQPAPGPYYAAADVFAFFSESESFGNAIVEAMSHGLAVATTRVGIVADWDEEAPLAIVDRDQPETTAQVLGELLRDTGRRVELGAAAADFVKGRFDAQTISREYIGHYHRLLGVSCDRNTSPGK
jgi:glycosyltransferase involved in cell wall biosynthesis